jgi:hypothetical protein
VIDRHVRSQSWPNAGAKASVIMAKSAPGLCDAAREYISESAGSHYTATLDRHPQPPFKTDHNGYPASNPGKRRIAYLYADKLRRANNEGDFS